MLGVQLKKVNDDLYEFYSNAFAEKVCLLIEDHELRKTMGQAGVLSAQRYDASRVMPMWKELFEHLALQV